MGQILRNDFSAGYIPSDDWYNGRDNGLMRMDNCFLDEFGNLSLVRGNTHVNTSGSFPSPVDWLYSKTMSSTVYRYAALANGKIMRDTAAGNFSTPTIIQASGNQRTQFASAFGFNLITNGNNRYKDDTSGTLRNLGIKAPAAAPTVASVGGAGNVNGSYQYIQVNVAELSQYTAQSPGSTAAAATTIVGSATVTPYTTGVDAQVTHYYIFRFGGTLDTYYFVGKVAVGAGAFTDNVSDATALLTDIQLNQFLASIGDLTDEILMMAGPFYGRMLYMTYKQIIISMQYNIDAYDTRKVIQLSSASGTQGKNLFLTSFPLAVILAATTDDIYEITGTFSDLPDGTIDVLIRPYGLDQPPISETFALYNNRLFYVANDGIRELTGITAMLISQNLQALWKNPTTANNRYGVNNLLAPGQANQIPYKLCVNNNRLYCVLADYTSIFTCYVYYLGRENNQGGYWYRYVIDPAILITEENGNLLAGFGDGGVGDIYSLDVQGATQLNGANISLNVIFPFSKNEINQRKDTYVLRFHIDTGNNPLTLTGYTEFGSSFSLGTITANGLQEVNILINSTQFNLSRRMTIQLSGITTAFTLKDWSIDYEPRPEPLGYLRIATNYGIAAKKRIRTIPIVIDTRGQAVNINATIDGVAYGNQAFTTSDRTTVFYYFNTDVFPTDIVVNITAGAGNIFEYYEAPSPVNVEILPVGKLFDQIGPVEFERNGELFEFRVRMMATTNTITYNVFMDDVSVIAAQALTVTPSVDMTYGPIKVPKGIRGSVCRIEFLSSNGVFYRWNCKIKYYSGGIKSDTRQITIQDKSVGVQS